MNLKFGKPKSAIEYNGGLSLEKKSIIRLKRNILKNVFSRIFEYIVLTEFLHLFGICS